MLRKSGKQLFMDEFDQLTTSEAGHTDLAEIVNVGTKRAFVHSSAAWRTNTANCTRTGCDLLTCEGSSRAADLLRDNCPTVCWFRVSCALCCPWRWRECEVSDKPEVVQRTKVVSSRTEIGDAIVGHRRPLRVGLASRLSGVGAA